MGNLPQSVQTAKAAGNQDRVAGNVWEEYQESLVFLHTAPFWEGTSTAPLPDGDGLSQQTQLIS